METIRQTLSDLHLGDVSIHQNMAVMPLLSGHEKIAEYLTLDEALSKKHVHIKTCSYQTMTCLDQKAIKDFFGISDP